jgi:fucose permease
MKKSHQYYIFFMCFLGMMLAALSSSYRGFFVPTYKAEFGITNTHMGMIISIAQISSMAFSYVGGKYCLRIGPKKLIFLGYLINAGAIVLVLSAHSWPLLFIGFCGMSSGTALLVLSLNTMLPMVTLFSQAVIMNFGHGIFGFGSAIYQKSLGWYLTNAYDWRMLFLISAFVYIASAVLVWFTPGEPTDEHRNHRSRLIHKKLSFALLLALMFYVTSEFLIGTWIINYFQEGYGYSPSRASFYSTLFYGTFTAGRLVGGVIFHKVSRLNGIVVFSSLAIISLLAGQMIGGPLLILLGISGIFYSVIYPTTITLVNDTYGNDSAYFIGLSALCTATGVFALNLIFGYFNDRYGVHATFYLIPFTMTLSLIGYLIARHEYQKIKAARLHARQSA